MAVCKKCGESSRLGEGQCWCRVYTVRDAYSFEQKKVYADSHEGAAKQYMADKYQHSEDVDLVDVHTTLVVSNGVFVKTFNINSVFKLTWNAEEERR